MDCVFTILCVIKYEGLFICFCIYNIFECNDENMICCLSTCVSICFWIASWKFDLMLVYVFLNIMMIVVSLGGLFIYHLFIVIVYMLGMWEGAKFDMAYFCICNNIIEMIKFGLYFPLKFIAQ